MKRSMRKWSNYFPVYERHLAKFQGKPIRLLEVGVDAGGSLRFWKEKFPEGLIYGIDVNKGSVFSEPGIEVFLCNQRDRNKLREIAEKIGPIDVLIDDGGHRAADQIPTFEEIYPRMSPDGVYVCEDLHTAYWPDYTNGQPSFMDYLKAFADRLTAWHVPGAEPDRATQSVHFYGSMCVIERAPMQAPVEDFWEI